MLDESSSEVGGTTLLPNSSNQSRTSQKKSAPGVEEAINLLTSWELPELHAVFREQEISLRALKYITDAEVSELIPKVGPRTIFRAMLNDWRQEQGLDQTKSPATRTTVAVPEPGGRKRNFDHAFVAATNSSNNRQQSQNNSLAIVPTIKREGSVDVSEPTWLEAEKDHSDDDSLLIESYDSNSLPQQTLSTERDALQSDALQSDEYEKIANRPRFEPASRKPSKYQLLQRDYHGERLDVYEILMSTCEGQCALDYYKQNDSLDLKNRKRVVSVLIRAIVERRICKYTHLFHDMSLQLVRLFPNERYETYYVAHRGTTPARGALYHRYSNYTRQLRKDGLLKYKTQQPR